MEQPSQFRQEYDLRSLDLKCPVGQIVRGIAMDLSAICTPLSGIIYEDGKMFMSPKKVALIAKDCQATGTTGTAMPKNATQGNSQATASQLFYIGSIDPKSGEIHCKEMVVKAGSP
jgi:hypothetical protein